MKGNTHLSQWLNAFSGAAVRWVFLILIGTLVMQAFTDPIAIAEDRCPILRKQLLALKQELSEYVDALGRTPTREDLSVLTVLNNKINELVPRIKELEGQLSDCPPISTPQVSPGMAEIKSDEQNLAEKSCEELKKMLLPLIRKVNSLKRRRQSVLSGLSPEEKTELDKAQGVLALVKEQIGKKCGPRTSPQTPARRLWR